MRADIERRNAQLNVTTDDIAASYLPQMAAVIRPPRTANSPD